MRPGVCTAYPCILCFISVFGPNRPHRCKRESGSGRVPALASRWRMVLSLLFFLGSSFCSGPHLEQSLSGIVEDGVLSQDEIHLLLQTEDPLIVAVWATWCEPCLPGLFRLSRERSASFSAIPVLALAVQDSGDQELYTQARQMLSREFYMARLQPAEEQELFRRLDAGPLVVPTYLLFHRRDGTNSGFEIFRGEQGLENMLNNLKRTEP